MSGVNASQGSSRTHQSQRGHSMTREATGDNGAERIIKKLGRIEELLVNLVALQACVADANRTKVARLLGVDNGRVSKVSSALKRKRGEQQ
jgi:hypothetical protein